MGESDRWVKSARHLRSDEELDLAALASPAAINSFESFSR